MGKRQSGGECVKRRFDDFSSLNVGMMIEIILGPRVSWLRDGPAQGLFAKSRRLGDPGRGATPSAEAAGRHVAPGRRQTKSASLPSAVGNLSKRANFKLSIRGLCLALFLALVDTFDGSNFFRQWIDWERRA